MEQSILKTIKKMVGIPEDQTDFDVEIVVLINSAFGLLFQLGVGPEGVFSIGDDAEVWNDLGLPADQLGLVKEYLYRKVKESFDPPETSFHLDALKSRIAELEKRLNIMTETAP